MPLMNTRKRIQNQVLNNINPLHSDGFVVYPGAITVSDKLQEQLLKRCRKNARTIFNHHEDRNINDHKRQQCSLTRNTVKINEFLDQVEEMISENHPHLNSNNWVVIYSKAGCGDQASHCDYVPNNQLARIPDEVFPLALLVAIMPGTKIHIWKGSHRLAYLNRECLEEAEPVEKTTVYLNPGDVLVFRGDLVHAGAGYEDENVRVHTFLESPLYMRRRNSTFLVYKHGSDELREIITV